MNEVPPSKPANPADELEFPRILEQVAARAAAAPGAVRIRAARPYAKREEAESELEAVTQMGTYLTERPESVFPCLYDQELLRRLTIEGVVLEPGDFMAIRKTLGAIADLKKRATATLNIPAPRVAQSISRLPPMNDLARALDQVFNDHGEVQDRASPALADIRRKRRGLIASAESALKGLLRDSKLEKWLAEEYFTQTNGRYVVLVRAEAKGQVPGIVQGQSKSGNSLYVEPMALVERNNELIRSYFEEEQEIARILRKLSQETRAHGDELSLALDLLAWLDSLAARARWAFANGGRAPEFTADYTFELRRAIHPLLGERCVPIDIRAGPDDRVLVLGGANSGGKTVALKIAGLLHFMASCGFPIPCADGSRTAFFKRVFCEIGDKQSIDSNLSSFSSHVSDVAAIVKTARKGDLILLDEFMTGTDPQEGSALAEAILLELADRGTLTIITTHYNSIKLLKDRYPGFKNYAVEFDWKTLAPTYRLLENEHGASAGLEIAGRFGLPQVLTDKARSLLKRGEGSVSNVLSRLGEERARARSARDEAEKLVAENTKLKESYEKQLSQLKEERRIGLSKHLREERLELVALRDFVREAARTGQYKDAVEAIEERATVLEKHEEELAPAPSSEPIHVGDRVLVLDLNIEGELLDLGARHATVRLATGMPLKTRIEALRKLQGKPKTVPSRGGRVTVDVSTSAGDDGAEPVPLELNLIQMRAEDAREKLAWYLDRASARGYKEVRIVHGKGDGILRRVVDEFLRSSVYAVDWRVGELGEGDTGVTIVRLANSV